MDDGVGIIEQRRAKAWIGSKPGSVVNPFSLVVALSLAGFVLRAWRLDYQSFWLDEGFSVSLSSGPLGYIIHQSFTKEPNPPLYFLLLHAWRYAAGSSEYAIRFLSLVPATLVVPLLFLIGRRLGNTGLGLTAAALAAVSPFLVWFAQEARMYSLELFWVTLGAYFLLRALARTLSRGSGRGQGEGPFCGQPSNKLREPPLATRDWALFSLASLLAVYSHLYAIFVLAAEALFLLGWRRQWRPAALSIGLVVLLFLPWLASISVYSGESSTWRGFIGIWDMIRVLLLNLASQAHLPGQIDGWFSLLIGVAVFGGMLVILLLRWLPGVRSIARSAAAIQRLGWLGVTWLIFPIAAVYLISFKEPLFSPRYFIVVAPAFLLLAAIGLAALPRPLMLAGLALLSAGSVWAIERGNTVPVYAKEDYRLAGTYVGARTEAGDVVLLVADYIIYPFEYYFHGMGKVLPFDVTPQSNVAPLLAPLAGKYDHIWLVEAHDVFVDPQDHVGKWLRGHYLVADEKYITGIHFIEFDPHARLEALPSDATPVNVRWQDGPELAGFQLRPGNPEGVRLFWKANGPLPRDYHISLKLWTDDGKLGGQQDGEPLNAGLQFSHFPASGFIRDDHYIAAKPGTYVLKMSIYLQADVPIVGQQDRTLTLGTVRIG